MSNIYIQEPPTNGKVLLSTTVGDIDIELWSKEAPKACRNFVQLCMEGYYDGTVFHRVVKDFIVQGGDPTGTGEGGESIYGHPFKDEFHTRLRFVRRGLVAMANAGPNDNGSQFFFTLAAAPELNNKHTVFGKVAGDTVYNMLKLADCEIGADDRPVFPCQINKTQILSNPFDDIVPRENRRSKKDDKGEKKSKSKSRATKNFSLLSFGEEAEEDEEEVNKVTKDIRVKSKSSHDLADDPRLSSVPVVERDEEEAVKRPASESEGEEEEGGAESTEERSKILSGVRKKLKKNPEEKSANDNNKELLKAEEEVEPEKMSRSEELRIEARKLKKEIRNSRKKMEPSVKEETTVEEKKEDLPINDAIAAYRQERQKYKNLRKEQKKKGSAREDVTLSLLKKFQSKLVSARTVASGYSDDEEENKDEKDEMDEDDDDNDMSWMSHKLKFDEKLNKVLDANVTDVERYEIFDPRNPINKRRREASKPSRREKR